MSIQHIGAAGELLVQYQLLKLGIDSVRLTTDAGIDLGPGGHVRAVPTAGYPGRRASREMLMTPQVVEALTAWSDRNR